MAQLLLPVRCAHEEGRRARLAGSFEMTFVFHHCARLREMNAAPWLKQEVSEWLD